MEMALTSLRIKWPKLTSTGMANAVLAPDSLKSIAMASITDTIPGVKGTRPVRKVNGALCGIAKSWQRASAEDGTLLLRPCFSFQTRFFMQNNEYALQFLNVPTLKKYFKQ